MNREGVPRDVDLRSESARVMREEVEDAVRKLVMWAGDDPDREGLVDTPRRVVKEAYHGAHVPRPTDGTPNAGAP